MDPAAIVFDLDGVLVDSEEVWDEVRQRVVADRGGRWPADATTALQGMSTPEWSAYLAELVGDEPEAIAGQVIGAPETVRAGVSELVERTGVDELMVVTSTHDGADRLRSYRLLADAVLSPTHATPVASGTAVAGA